MGLTRPTSIIQQNQPMCAVTGPSALNQLSGTPHQFYSRNTATGRTPSLQRVSQPSDRDSLHALQKLISHPRVHPSLLHSNSHPPASALGSSFVERIQSSSASHDRTSAQGPLMPHQQAVSSRVTLPFPWSTPGQPPASLTQMAQPSESFSGLRALANNISSVNAVRRPFQTNAVNNQSMNQNQNQRSQQPNGGYGM